jgi:hypothetical protein
LQRGDFYRKDAKGRKWDGDASPFAGAKDIRSPWGVKRAFNLKPEDQSPWALASVPSVLSVV